MTKLNHDKETKWHSHQSDTLTSKNFYHQYLIAHNVKRFSRIHQFTRICPLFSPQHPISSSLELLHGHPSKLPIVLQHPEFQIFPTAKLLLGCSIHFRNNHKTGLLLLIEMGFCKGALTCKNHIYWCPASLTFHRKNSYRASKVWGHSFSHLREFNSSQAMSVPTCHLFLFHNFQDPHLNGHHKQLHRLEVHTWVQFLYHMMERNGMLNFCLLSSLWCIAIIRNSLTIILQDIILL